MAFKRSAVRSRLSPPKPLKTLCFQRFFFVFTTFLERLNGCRIRSIQEVQQSWQETFQHSPTASAKFVDQILESNLNVWYYFKMEVGFLSSVSSQNPLFQFGTGNSILYAIPPQSLTAAVAKAHILPWQKDAAARAKIIQALPETGFQDNMLCHRFCPPDGGRVPSESSVSH